MNRRELKVHVKQSEHVFSSYLQNCISNDTWGKRWPQFSLHFSPLLAMVVMNKPTNVIIIIIIIISLKKTKILSMEFDFGSVWERNCRRRRFVSLFPCLIKSYGTTHFATARAEC